MKKMESVSSDNVVNSAKPTNTLRTEIIKKQKTRIRDRDFFAVPQQTVDYIHGSYLFRYVSNEERLQVTSFVSYTNKNLYYRIYIANNYNTPVQVTSAHISSTLFSWLPQNTSLQFVPLSYLLSASKVQYKVNSPAPFWSHNVSFLPMGINQSTRAEFQTPWTRETCNHDKKMVV